LFGNLTYLDWAIVIGSIVALRLVSLSTRKYMKGVADFLAGNRCAGRYLLMIAGGMGDNGPIGIVATFEVLAVAGFCSTWWGFMTIPIGVILMLTGWVYYRFRETKAMTLAQFMEMRYSRGFRLLTGISMWFCGILNFGIFPAVAARFIIYFCGLPEHFHLIPGMAFTLPTYPIVMAGDLGLAMTFVSMGGQISVMVTECVQGMVSSMVYILIAAVLLATINWHRMIFAMSQTSPEASLLNPFHTRDIPLYNFWFALIGIFGSFYLAGTWQGTSGYNCAAYTAHEQKMGIVASRWRGLGYTVMIAMLGLGGYALMRLPEYASLAHIVNAHMAHITNKEIRAEMVTPIAMALFLPPGIKGLLAMVVIFFSFSSVDTYMHSWGTIFVQDVVLPIRGRPFEPSEHIKWLRLSIWAVAIWAFLFSLFYIPGENIPLFFAITGTFYSAGAGATICLGLYWKKGTTAAAYTALITGMIFAVGGFAIGRIWPKYHHGHDFFINDVYISFIACLVCLFLYVVVSLLTCKPGKEINMDKLLNRGQYREGPHPEEHKVTWWQQVVGITSEFSFGDKCVAVAVLIWNFGWFAFFIIISAISLIHPQWLGENWWPNFWHSLIWLYFALSIPASTWLIIGAGMDLRLLFQRLSTAARDSTDDGFIRQRLEDEVEPETAIGTEQAPIMDPADQENKQEDAVIAANNE